MPEPTDLEPVLDWTDIQGNVLAGFNKDHQTLLGLSLGHDREGARRFVAVVADRVTSLRTVVLFKRERRARLLAEAAEPQDLTSCWLAVAFSFAGLTALTPDAGAFSDLEFRQGLVASAARLGDATDQIPAWKIGRPNNTPDLFLVIAADDDAERERAAEEWRVFARSLGLSVVYDESGHDLSFYSDAQHSYPSGIEHFGFKDGISQPGIRGVLPDGSYLTPRIGSSAVNDDDTVPEYAEPGKPLVCLGQFLLGHPRQLDNFPRQPGTSVPLGTAPGAVAPAWARNGSFLVFRRLRQDVAAFRDFAAAAADQIGLPEFPTSRVAAMLVGRWPSGAPLIRSPLRDNPAEATEARANAFAYGSDNPALGLPDDSQGTICPVAAHLRKVNPRDGDTDQGASSATLSRRLLRRGIPYGPPLPEGQRDGKFVDRGLFFLSYQASISLQFEFLGRQWMNSSDLPRNPSPHAEGLGFDMLVGQNTASDRSRFAYVRATGIDCPISTSNNAVKDWVIATGGGYFFAPSISALRDVLSLPPPS